MKFITYTMAICLLTFFSNKTFGQYDEFNDDRDGQTYRTIQIGEQVWFASNLNYESENSVWYNNKKKFGRRHGRLYTWEEAKTVCPNGWHLPSDKEWTELISYFGGGKNAGMELKADGSSGFDVFFSGFRDSTGTFFDLGHDANFWTSTSVGEYEAWRCYFDRGYSGVVQDYFSKAGGLSVRCIKD